MKKFFVSSESKRNAFLGYTLYSLQGHQRRAVKKPETTSTIAWRNPCREGKDLPHGCVRVCVSMSPVSPYAMKVRTDHMGVCVCVSVSPVSPHFVGVQGVGVSGVTYLNISWSWLRLIYIGLFGAECSTFRKL